MKGEHRRRPLMMGMRDRSLAEKVRIDHHSGEAAGRGKGKGVGHLVGEMGDGVPAAEEVVVEVDISVIADRERMISDENHARHLRHQVCPIPRTPVLRLVRVLRSRHSI